MGLNCSEALCAQNEDFLIGKQIVEDFLYPKNTYDA
jgi:hypothetical protein